MFIDYYSFLSVSGFLAISLAAWLTAGVDDNVFISMSAAFRPLVGTVTSLTTPESVSRIRRAKWVRGYYYTSLEETR